MKLVIVESPTKAKTLGKFLKGEYDVKASMGHVRDLPKSELGVDVEHNYEPKYVAVTTPRAKKVISDLKKRVQDADEVYLATDPDREGEAIAWHVLSILTDGKASKAKKLKVHRVVFHEITKEAVLNAFEHTSELNQHLIDAQQARRVLDRLVGYKLSPLLWKKVRFGLSAGRVQSVAVRIIVDREEERKNFKPEEYWTLDALLETLTKESLEAAFFEVKGKKADLKTKQEMDLILEKIEGSPKDSFKVKSVEKTTKKRNTYPPFMTSSLQQAASNKLGFVSKRTMSAAQALFEAGFITYHRTDSLSLSESFIKQARDFINKEYGKEYLPEEANIYKTKSRNAQEAHEAIRPTDIKNLSPDVEGDQLRLYKLIWQRAVASQMVPAIYDQVTVLIDFQNGELTFKSTGSTLKFSGWLKAQGVTVEEDAEKDEDEEKEKNMPEVKEGEVLKLVELKPVQHFTEPPPRFNEASLIKIMEENGIGRPSTYAPTISTIQARGYVRKEGKAFVPEDVAVVVTKLLVEHFPNIVDYGFTASMEENLDKIAEGELEWVPVIKEFYEPFIKELEESDAELKKKDMTLLEVTEEKCPECGKHLNIKLGKYGRFLSCSGFPDCKYAAPIATTNSEEAANIDTSQLGKCIECENGELMLKEGRFGKFIACSNYPKCKFTKPYLDKIGMKCPQCENGEVIIKKAGKFKKVFYGCSNYPDCKYISNKNPLTVAEKTEEASSEER